MLQIQLSMITERIKFKNNFIVTVHFSSYIFCDLSVYIDQFVIRHKYNSYIIVAFLNFRLYYITCLQLTHFFLIDLLIFRNLCKTFFIWKHFFIFLVLLIQMVHFIQGHLYSYDWIFEWFVKVDCCEWFCIVILSSLN